MGKRIVIALGGNALGKNLHEQMDAVHVTAKAIADLIQDGHEVVIAHGNGPQVGMIQNAFAAYHKQEAKSDIMPLSMCVAMSQGYIGYDLQNVIGEELDRRGAHTHVATVLTQVAVDPKDPAFQHPTKPIGAFMTEEEAKKLAAVEQQKGCCEVRPGEFEYTIYTSCWNAQRGVYYYTTYGCRQIHAVDMHRENLDSTSLARYPMQTEEPIQFQN